MAPELFNILVGSACAAGGYLFREYRNRVRPYAHIISIEGGSIRRTDERPDTPKKLIKRIDDAYRIRSLGSTPTVGTIHDAWDRADDYIRLWPRLRGQLKDVLGSNDKVSLGKTLPGIFSTHFLDRLMQTLLAGDKIKFPSIPTGAEDNVAVYPGEGKDVGTVWLTFPQNTVSFGRMMNEKVFQAKTRPFFRNLSTLDPKLIHPVIEQILKVGEKDYHISTEVEPQLKTLRDESSRWMFKVYFANLSNKPVMIHTICRLSVIDRPRRRFTEEAYVLLIRRSKSGASTYQDAVEPLIIKGGRDITFAVITQSQQKEMKLGTAMREAFERGQGNCRICLWLSKVGLLKKQGVRTSKAPFRGEVETE